MLDKILFIAFLVTIAYTSELKVVHPTYLKESIYGIVDGQLEEGVLRSSLGNYGDFNYGQNFRGRLHYPLANQNACREFKDSDFDEKHLKESRERNHRLIILVDRGECHFVIKSQHIQKYGAIMGVVIDNKRYENPRNLIMADDGSGSSVKIPTFLIGYSDGQKLIKAIHRSEENEEEKKEHGERPNWRNFVIIQGNVDIATKTNNPIELDMWYSSIYELWTNKFNLDDIGKMQRVLGNRVIFQPRTMVYNCDYCDKATKEKWCVKDGKYCPIYPPTMKNADKEKIEPLDLLVQSVKEQCMWYSLFDDKKNLWFKYLKKISDQCITLNPKRKGNELPQLGNYCEHEAKEMLSYLESENAYGIYNRTLYYDCMDGQVGALTGDKVVRTNDTYLLKSFFDRDRERAAAVGNLIHPSFTINNSSIRGDQHDPNQLFKGICSTMKRRPGICSKVSFNRDPLEYMMPQQYNKEFIEEETARRFRKHEATLQGMDRRARNIEIALGLVIMVLLTTIIFCFCRYYQEKDAEEKMKTQVNDHVQQYFQLAASDTEASQRENSQN